MKELRRVSQGILLGFMVVALAAAYWGVVRRDTLLSRPDNPRLVIAERQSERGEIYDQNGLLLAETTLNYNGEFLRRLYPHPEVASVVGYYSQRYGTSGIEAAYDSILRGEIGPSPFDEAIRDLRHDPVVGGDVRLTLDLAVQKVAAEALEPYNGAVLAVTIPDGAVRALVSAPAYDPNLLDADWEVLVNSPDGPLLNRVTQGAYQPGAALQTVLMAAALSTRLDIDSPIDDANAPLTVNGITLTCGLTPPDDTALTLTDAYIYGCPAAFPTLLDNLPAVTLDEAFWQYGLLTAPNLQGLPTDTADSPLPLALQADQAAQIKSVSGQSSFLISPLQMMELVSAIANNGNVPLIHLVDATRPVGQATWDIVEQNGLSRALLTSENAAAMRALMAQATAAGTGRAAQAFSAHPILGHAGTAYSGPEADPLQWFVGMTVLENGEAVAVVVVVEDAPNIDTAAVIGGKTLAEATERYAAAPDENAPVASSNQGG